MTTLNLFTAFVDGQPASADSIAGNFGTPSSADPAPSMEIINGWLDADNLETPLSSNRIGYNSFQVGSLTEGRMVGATLDHDYFERDFFSGFNEWIWVGPAEGGSFEKTGPAGTPAEIPLFVTIPGSGLNFYVTYPNCFIAFTWTIRWTHDGIAQEGTNGSNNTVPVNSFNGQEQAAVRLFLKKPGDSEALPPNNFSGTPVVGDLTYADNQRRNIGQVNAKKTAAPSYASVLSSGMYEAEKRTGGEGRFDFNRHREWSGSYILGAAGTTESPTEGFQIPGANTGVSAGWYEASLRIATSAKQARVQVRSMRYICFKLEVPPPG